MYKIVPKHAYWYPDFCSSSFLRCVIILLLIFCRLTGSPGPPELHVPQAHARKMVRHLVKKPFTHNWKNGKTICIILGQFYTVKFIHKNFYRVIVEPFFRNLVLNSLFHGLKLGKCRFSARDGEVVWPKN